MESSKEINSIQKAALEYLVVKAGLDLPDDWNRSLFVRQMDDGGMGSFLILQTNPIGKESRKFGRRASEYQFNDEDGVPVLVTLNLDENDELFEVDICKVDYSPVIKFKVPA
jgi:hypothetical protein